jgi:hypothetical protein
MPLRRTNVAASLALAILATLAASDTRAGNVRTRWFSGNATSFCQSALPVFDGNVRKRPLAVQNEGTGNAFVTCSFTGQATELADIAVFAINNTDVSVSLTCTAVTGGVVTNNTYNTKTIAIPAFGIQGVGWIGADYGGSVPGVGLFSVSCNLPPGVGIARASIEFQEFVGG